MSPEQQSATNYSDAGVKPDRRDPTISHVLFYGVAPNPTKSHGPLAMVAGNLSHGCGWPFFWASASEKQQGTASVC